MVPNLTGTGQGTAGLEKTNDRKRITSLNLLISILVAGTLAKEKGKRRMDRGNRGIRRGKRGGQEIYPTRGGKPGNLGKRKNSFHTWPQLNKER